MINDYCVMLEKSLGRKLMRLKYIKQEYKLNYTTAINIFGMTVTD